LLGPHAERNKTSTATEYFIVSTPSAYLLQLQNSTEPSLYRQYTNGLTGRFERRSFLTIEYYLTS
jgi:hypothetical protein